MAPRSKALYRYLAGGMPQQEGLGEPPPDDIRSLVEVLMTRLGIWWSVEAYEVMPIMTPWCVRDRSCRYDQGPESWGAPRADGFMRDDNSIIKKLPLPVAVSAPAGHPYAGRRPLRGFTACHIWRDLPEGRVAGEDPWLYSFMPNLVWLPSWLAPLTDRQDSRAQALLQHASKERFRGAMVDPHVRVYADYCWSQLPMPPPGPALDTSGPAEFQPDKAFFDRRIASLTKVVGGCDHVLAHGTTGKKLICTRYTEGLPKLSVDALAAFASEMRQYRDAASRVSDPVTQQFT